ncbi:Uncharacterised protein [Mycobacteroides abscessus subsp. abscessus]|nr:Uncharacterised protein [Mycobacteroides abscessus subsp. abscessus]
MLHRRRGEADLAADEACATGKAPAQIDLLYCIRVRNPQLGVAFSHRGDRRTVALRRPQISCGAGDHIGCHDAFSSSILAPAA